MSLVAAAGSAGARRVVPEVREGDPRGAAEEQLQEPAAREEARRSGRHPGEEGGAAQRSAVSLQPGPHSPHRGHQKTRGQCYTVWFCQPPTWTPQPSLWSPENWRILSVVSVKTSKNVDFLVVERHPLALPGRELHPNLSFVLAQTRQNQFVKGIGSQAEVILTTRHWGSVKLLRSCVMLILVTNMTCAVCRMCWTRRTARSRICSTNWRGSAR